MPETNRRPSLLIALLIALVSAGVLAFTIHNDHAMLTSNPSPASVASSPEVPAGAATEAVPSGNLSALFGVAQQEKKQQDAPEKLPETRLNLTLVGTFTHAESARASALIAESGQSSKRYFVGDVVPGDAELVNVNAGNVVLRRNGQDEVLKLPILKEKQPGETTQRTAYRRQLPMESPQMNPTSEPGDTENDARMHQAQLKDRLSRLRARLKESE